MARKSKNLIKLLGLGAEEISTVLSDLSKKEFERLNREVVRETNRALKTATKYTKSQFEKRAKRGKSVAKVYKTQARATQEIQRSIVVLRTEQSIREIQKTRKLSLQEKTWESLQEDSYFREWIAEFASEFGVEVSEADIQKMLRAYEALKSDVKVKRTKNVYYKLAKEVFTAWVSGSKENWDSLRTQIYNQWVAGDVVFADESDDDDIF